ncbi:TPA: glycosyltransferase family 2 protein [Burkholderia cenocepacia]|uniref:glycosyltransferase family 2 protein n=1 Tax=Burkholderia TaxID=32008 RepID=UPI001B983408|nr:MULTISPECIES: glycosyltransferase family 2 protein [Burkholderia]MBR8429759.1 glycosyltransferase family 2 protein [Burkholderia cenocepacia]MCL4634796.1 glycosyltransferase family 2 protein [Burkholderia sp.]MCW5120883.1 glycosyltransferase family 2 protein [Burkholderia cenocepacia]MCW5132746.1 glycosyltransferase family 2 protein [Burkholderia cenocepacia]MCW5175435.1 glycosyltransferase family 2 protein [Burkholderia cenocepacia]
MFDFNALRLSWRESFLVNLTATRMGALEQPASVYRLDVRLLAGWYMIEILMSGEAAQQQVRLNVRAGSSPGTFGMAVSTRQISKRLVRIPAGGRIEIDLGDQPIGRIKTFRLARVTTRFARSRMMTRLQSLHPRYKPWGDGYGVQDVDPRHSDIGQLWHDYCALFEESASLVSYQDWASRFDTPNREVCNAMQARLRRFSVRPVFAIGIEVTESPSAHWETALRSVVEQIYPHWRLVIVDLRPSQGDVPLLPPELRANTRIQIVSGETAAESHTEAERLLAQSGNWILFHGQHDVLPKHALYVLADALERTPDVDMIYSDQDDIDRDGVRHSPCFHTAWNEDLVLSSGRFLGLGAYRTEIFVAAGGRDLRHGNASCYDMTLRCLAHTKPDRILHIPRVLYHRRAERASAQNLAAQYHLNDERRHAIERHLARIGAEASVSTTAHGYRIQYVVPQSPPLVTLIIPTRNGFSLLSRCVDSIIEKTRYRPFEIIIVDNGSDEPDTLEYMTRVFRDHGVCILRDDRPFNYSALNNRAVEAARGEFVALVNNDIEVIDGGWLDELMGHALRPEIGVVGPKLLYTNGTVQHAGVIMGLSGCADHLSRGLGRDEPGYMERAVLTQSLSAVTGACLVVRRSLYRQLGGLNEDDLKVAFNDVDFCLRVRQAGYAVVWTPHAVLYHHESATRGSDDTAEKMARAAREIEYMRKHWGDVIFNDPAYNPNLSLDRSDCQLAWPPRVPSLEHVAHRMPTGS